MSSNTNSGILESFVKLIPYLYFFFEDDVAFSVCDREKYIKLDGLEKFNLSVKEGDLISHDGSDYLAIRDGKPHSKIIPREVFGTEVKSISIPVKDDTGNVAGCVSLVKSTHRQYEISNLSQNLSSALQQISATISQISTGIQLVAESSNEILKNAEDAKTEAENTDEILEFVKNVADQTNLLGLNAAIEAARAGETGRGFTVVAQEIRKLSKSSNESVKKIGEVLKKINQSITDITNKINKTSEVFGEQASALEEITASIEELTSSAQVLEEIASKY